MAPPDDRPSLIPWPHRLRVQIALGTTALVAMALASTLLIAGRLITDRSMASAADQLQAAESAFQHLIEGRAEFAAARVQLITMLPVFRAHLTNPRLLEDAPTMTAMADDYRDQLAANWLIVTNSAGEAVATSGSYPIGDVGTYSPAASRLTDLEPWRALVIGDGALWLVVSEPALFDRETLGAVTAGFVINDAIARELAEVTHSQVNLAVGPVLVASSLPEHERAVVMAHLNRRNLTPPQHITLQNAGQSLDYVVGAFPVTRDGSLDGSARLLLFQDWAPTARVLVGLRMRLLITGAVIFGLTLVGGTVIGAHVGRPLDDVAQAAGEISAGHWARQIPVRGRGEAAAMATAFNAMGAELQRSYARLHERTQTLEAEVLERQRVEIELVAAKEAAEQANLAKSAFLAGMSHELRTPLTAIMGYSELIEDHARDTGDVACVVDVQHVRRSADHLLTLINGVLDLSKIEAGRMELDLTVFDADTLVVEVVQSAERLATARRNRIVMGDLRELGDVYSDQTKLRQVLLNLMSNACKFTSDGTVRLDACRGDDDWLTFRVTDSGIGMSPEQLRRLFQDFVQGDQTTTRRFGGTGLGLAISQRLCHLMGGSITVESRQGHGSTFTVRVPCHRMVATNTSAA